MNFKEFLETSLRKEEPWILDYENHSTDETENVVRNAQSSIDIKYHKNSGNLGHARNYLNVVTMADGDFIWLIGDDDLLMPYAIEDLYKLIDGYPDVDFFFVNSFHLTTEYVKNYPAPFDTVNLPKDMVPFSKWTIAGEMPFLQLINPKISFDFLGGMFLSVFRKKNWMLNANVLDENAIQDNRTFSHFDNTFPHVKIFAKAFSKSKGKYINFHGDDDFFVNEGDDVKKLINLIEHLEEHDDIQNIYSNFEIDDDQL